MNRPGRTFHPEDQNRSGFLTGMRSFFSVAPAGAGEHESETSAENSPRSGHRLMVDYEAPRVSGHFPREGRRQAHVILDQRQVDVKGPVSAELSEPGEQEWRQGFAMDILAPRLL